MMLTTKSRYGVMALLEVASNDHKTPMKLSDISKNQSIPLNYLEQIFLKLRNSGIITSVKGPGGGYYLSKDPADINIIDIIDAVEENTKMTRCSVDKNCRRNGVKCMTHDLWKGLGSQIRNYLSAISVKDVLLNQENNNVIYLDHNATTPLINDAKDAMIKALEKPSNPSSIHHFGRLGKKIIENARKQIAKLAGIDKDFRKYQITFTASGTEANNLILSNFQHGEIFISNLEHASILAHTKYCDNIHLIKTNKDGILDNNDLIEKLSVSTAQKKLVSVIAANNESGVIQDIKKITQIVHEFGAMMHSDYVQAFGKIPVNLIDLDVDFITISSHKIGGPLGAGALISKVKNHLLPLIIGGGQEKGLRSGTENIAAIAGFGAAAEAVKINENVLALRNYLEAELLNIVPDIIIVSRDVLRLPNTSLIINKGKKAETQVIAFDLNNIAISSGAACSSGKIGSSDALAAMGFDTEEQNSAIRISLGNTNTKNDIDRFLEIYKKLNNYGKN